jgi:hypothetical protein
MAKQAKISITDGGLWLGVLNALIEAEALDANAIAEELGEVADDGKERDRVLAVIEELKGVSVKAAAIAAIEELDFDGGNQIYMAIEEALDIDTGGEENYYEVQSLDGIAELRNLQRIDFDGHGQNRAGLDLAPLAGHPKLAEIRLIGGFRNAAALEKLPALKKVVVRSAELDDPSVLDRLAARGVTIKR